MSHRTSSRRAGMLFATVALFAISIESAAQTARRHYEIPAQDAAAALREFARQSGRQVLFPYDAASGRRAPEIRGEFSDDDVLKRLADSAGLVVNSNEGGTVTLTTVPRFSAVNRTANFATGGAEEIVVTAQKRSERLVDTPQSVSVLGAKQLAALGAVQFRDWANTVPGLSFLTAGAGSNQIIMRGITTGLDNSSTVGILFDDVPVGSSTAFGFGGRLAFDPGLFEIDRIEVLRGPQGTLYGASTMGGLVKYVSRLPDTHAIAGSVQAGVSGTEGGGVNFITSAALNLPIVADKAAVRLSGYESHDGGFIRNAALGSDNVNRSDVYGGRIDLLLLPTEDLSVRLNAFAQDIDRKGRASADYNFAGSPRYGDLAQNRNIAEPFNQRFRLVSADIKYDFGAVSLASISSFQTIRTREVYDITAVFGPLPTTFLLPNVLGVAYPSPYNTDKFTQEVRLQSRDKGPIEWIVGGFYTHEKSGGLMGYQLRTVSAGVLPNLFLTTDTPTKFEEVAGFADVTYRPTEQFDISAGIRVAHNNQSYMELDDGVVTKPLQKSSQDVVTYLANARYHVSSNATAYLRFATGYRPGGPNYRPLDPATGVPTVAVPSQFEADKLKSYEAGYKADLLNGKFSIDVAGYYIEWSNIQLLAGIGGFVNGGGATVRGGELTLTARPQERLQLTATMAYQDPTLSDAVLSIGGRAGDRLPNVPRFSATLNADWQLLDGGLEPALGATLRHTGARPSSFDRSASIPQYRLPSYTSFDLRGAVQLDTVQVQLYAHNLFDTRGQLGAFTGYSISGGPAQVTLLQPRTIGVTATVRF